MATRRQKEKRKVQYGSAQQRVETHEAGWQPTSFTVPEGMEIFRFEKAGNYKLDIIPFVTGEGNQFAEPGFVWYERTYQVHKDVGPDGRSFCCPQQFKKRCPICDHVANLRREGNTDKDTIQEMRPKERQLWLVRNLKEPDKGDEKWQGIQLMEYAYYGKGMGFGEMLDAKIKAVEDEDSPIVSFFHLDGGMTLLITTKEDSFNGRKFYKPINIEMIPRKEEYPESILDVAPCLDELVKEISPKKLKEIFEGGQEDEDEDDKEVDADTNGEVDDEDVTPKKNHKVKVRGKPKEEDPEESETISKGDMVDHEEYGICEVVHVSGDRTSLKIQDEEGDIHKAIDPGDCTLVEDEEEDEEPEEEEEAPKKGKKGKKPAPKEEPEDDEEEETDDDEEEDEEPAPKKRGRPPAKKKAVEEDDDWDDDNEPLEDDEEEEEEKPRRRAKK